MGCCGSSEDDNEKAALRRRREQQRPSLPHQQTNGKRRSQTGQVENRPLQRQQDSGGGRALGSSSASPSSGGNGGSSGRRLGGNAPDVDPQTMAAIAAANRQSSSYAGVSAETSAKLKDEGALQKERLYNEIEDLTRQLDVLEGSQGQTVPFGLRASSIPQLEKHKKHLLERVDIARKMKAAKSRRRDT